MATKVAAVVPEVQFLVSLYRKEAEERAKQGKEPHDRSSVLGLLGGVRQIYAIRKVQPLSMFAGPAMQIPFFIYFASDLRRSLAGEDPVLAEALSSGGAGWFVDLTVPDPICVLPVLCGGLLYGNLEMAFGRQNLSGEAAGKSLLAGKLKDMFLTISLLLPPVLAVAPAGIQFYLSTSLVFTSVQSAALRNDGVRTALGLPSLAVAAKEKPILAREFLSEMEVNMREQNQQRQAREGVGRGNPPRAGVGVLRNEFLERRGDGGGEDVIVMGTPGPVTGTPANVRNPDVAPHVPNFPPSEVIEAANRGEIYRPIVFADNPDLKEGMSDDRPQVLNKEALDRKKSRKGKGKGKGPARGSRQRR